MVYFLCFFAKQNSNSVLAHPSNSATRSAGVEAVAELNRLFNLPRSFQQEVSGLSTASSIGKLGLALAVEIQSPGPAFLCRDPTSGPGKDHCLRLVSHAHIGPSLCVGLS